LANVNAQFPEPLQFLFQPMRYKVLYGGRGGSKSWGVARALLTLAAKKPLRIL
jgi:phage terminase large subunit